MAFSVRSRNIWTCGIRPEPDICRRFSLVELLAMLAVITVLAALLLPSLQRAHVLARQTSCCNNMKMMGYAFSLYAEDNHGFAPVADFFRQICPLLGVTSLPPFPLACPGGSFTCRSGKYDTNLSVNGLLGTKDPVTYFWSIRLAGAPRPSGTYFVYDGVLNSADPASGYHWATLIPRANPTVMCTYFDHLRHPGGGMFLFLDWHARSELFPLPSGWTREAD